MVSKTIIFCLYIILAPYNYSQTKGIDNTISGKFYKQTLRNVLTELNTKYQIDFIYNDKLIDDVLVTCTLASNDLESTMKKLLRGTNISFRIFREKDVVLFREHKSLSKNIPVKPIVIQKDLTEIDTNYIVQKPVLLSKSKMEYPVEAVNNKIEGKVSIKFLIDSKGDVSKVLLISSSGSSLLDSATLSYSRKLKFISAEANGKLISVWMSMSFEFLCEKK